MSSKAVSNYSLPFMKNPCSHSLRNLSEPIPKPWSLSIFMSPSTATRTIIFSVQNTTLSSSPSSLTSSARITTGKSTPITYRSSRFLWLLLSLRDQSTTYYGSNRFLHMRIGNLLICKVLDLLRIYTSIFQRLHHLTSGRSFRLVSMWLMMMGIS